MKYNYTTDFIFIRSNWFEVGDNKFKRVGDKAFFLYLNMFKFLVNNQEIEYTFYTSIDKLRKCTGYSENDIVTLIKLLEKEKIIKTSITKWSRMYIDKKLKDHEFIIIHGIAKPNVIYDDKSKKNKPATDSPDDKWILIDLRLMQLYQDRGFSEKFYPIFCLINGRSNTTERKMWMEINKMAELLGFGDQTVTNIIRELNRNYLMYSRKVDNGKKGKRFEHYILNNLDHLDLFTKMYKEQIDQIVKRWDNPKKKKYNPVKRINSIDINDVIL